MRTRQRVKHVRAIVDLLAVDREDRPVLIGEVKQKDETAGAALARIQDFLEFADLSVPFVIIVDHDRITFYRGDEEELRDEPIFSVKTKSILGYYSEYHRETKRKVGTDLLRGLALGWLKDISYRWRSESTLPPAYEELERLGLAPLLKDATFDYEVAFGGYRLYRDKSPHRPGSGAGA
jgi:hypothetical protein